MASKKPVSIKRSKQNPPTPKPDTHGMQDGAASHTPTPGSVRLLLTVKEAAQALAIDRSTLYERVMRGEIRSITIGRARRIPVWVLEEWIAQQIAV